MVQNEKLEANFEPAQPLKVSEGCLEKQMKVLYLLSF